MYESSPRPALTRRAGLLHALDGEWGSHHYPLPPLARVRKVRRWSRVRLPMPPTRNIYPPPHLQEATLQINRLALDSLDRR